MDDTIVFVRSIGERTSKRCQDCLPGCIVVSEIPFSATIKKCFQLAIESGKRHVVCCDADVIPDKHMVSALVDVLRKNDKIYAATGQCLDKLLGRVRTVGIQAYNINLLPIAIKHVDAGTYSIRPEKFIRDRMNELGYPTKRIKGRLGTHGFDQYYSDIYRCARIMRKKFWKSGSKNLKRWKREAKQDPDYLVALAGWRAGDGADNLFIDASIDLNISKVLRKLNLKEKEPL